MENTTVTKQDAESLAIRYHAYNAAFSALEQIAAINRTASDYNRCAVWASMLHDIQRITGIDLHPQDMVAIDRDWARSMRDALDAREAA